MRAARCDTMPLADYWFPFPEQPLGFPKFRKLPAELRLKIWQDALPGPRTIHLVNHLSHLHSLSPSSLSVPPSPDDFKISSPVHSPPDISRSRPRKSNRKRCDVVSHCRSTVKCPREVTAMLHTCRESRFEVLSRYQPLFAPKANDDKLFRLHYFDPLIDGIFLEAIWPWVRTGNSKPTNIFKARKLNISCNAWYFKWAVASPQLLAKSGLLRFKNLEELHIVYRVLTEQEREKINNYRHGHYMGPGDMTTFLKEPNSPHDIAFPSLNVDVRVDEIMEHFQKMKAANPDWSIPKVKLVTWAKRSDSPVNSPEW